MKRTSNGDTKCNCKTNCVTRICTCRKNKILCGNNCKCGVNNCQNRDQKNVSLYLYIVSNDNHIISYVSLSYNYFLFSVESYIICGANEKRRRMWRISKKTEVYLNYV